MIEAIATEFAALNALEVLAVLLALAYLILAIRQNIWCWAAAFTSTSIYVYLFHDVALLMESALNAFYMAMAVYGWWQWRGGMASDSTLAVCRWPWRLHLGAIIVIVALSVVTAKLTQRYFSPVYPVLDSLTTWSAVWATFLVARKELLNWWYWFAIDAASIFLYINRGLALTALLFVVYLVLIPIGYRNWRESYAQT